MASAKDNDGIPPVPELPPMGGFASHMSGDEPPRSFIGQSSSPGAASGTQNTPSPYHISVRHSDEPSAISGLTAPNTANASEDNSKRIRTHANSSDGDEPSPKKALPDFSLHKSEEDSVASGTTTTTNNNGSSGSGFRICCGSSGSGRSLQRAAGRGSGGSGTQQSNGRGRTLQRAAGQRQQWKRLSHLLWQRKGKVACM